MLTAKRGPWTYKTKSRLFILELSYFIIVLTNQKRDKSYQGFIFVFRHSQYRLKTFTEQLFICHNDSSEQRTSLNKLREFHSVLKEQDEISLKKLSTIYNQLINLENQYKISLKSLQQTNEDLTKYSTVRSVLGRMIVRRVNLCQLLYKKLARFDEHIHQREQSIQIISKCINSLKTQIRQIREQNKKFIEKKDKIQLEVNHFPIKKKIHIFKFRL